MAQAQRFGIWVPIKNPRPATKMLAAETDGWMSAGPSLAEYEEKGTGYVVSTSREGLEQVVLRAPARDPRVSLEVRPYP